MLRLLVAFLLSVVLLPAFGQKKDAYIIYNAKGKKVSYRKLLRQVDDADIILFGEHHNNPISHWLQFELSTDLHSRGGLILGAEMFEADNQDALDLYLAGQIDGTGLDSMARLWPNYKTDYAPLVEFAKEKNLPFIATNIPRRYASLVYRKGFEALDTLPGNEKEWIVSLPPLYDPELPSYKAMLEMVPGHGGENFPKAQAIKDATMAHFIYKHLDRGDRFLHFNGVYHSDSYEGIGWYLLQADPTLQIRTISTVLQKNNRKLAEENEGIADFIICVDADMTTTY